jgi:hypothetical protein
MFEMLKFGDAKQEFLDVLPNQRKRNVDEVNEDIDDYYNKFYLNLDSSLICVYAIIRNDVPVKRGRPKKAKVEK